MKKYLLTILLFNAYCSTDIWASKISKSPRQFSEKFQQYKKEQREKQPFDISKLSQYPVENIIQQLEQLEKRYKEVTQEFKELSNYYEQYKSFASPEDKAAFDALWQEGEDIFKQKRNLQQELERIQKSKPSPGGFPEKTIKAVPYEALLHKASYASLFEKEFARKKAWVEENWKKLLNLLARFRSIRKMKNNFERNFSPEELLDSAMYNDLSKEEIDLGKQMEKILKDPRSPSYFHEIYFQERFSKPITPAQPQASDEPILIKFATEKELPSIKRPKQQQAEPSESLKEALDQLHAALQQLIIKLNT